MMSAKETIKNNILVAMRIYIDSTTMQILEAVISKALFAFDITDRQQLPATMDNTNKYIWDLFEVKKGSKLSQETMEQYRMTVHRFMAFIDRPVTIADENDVENFLAYLKRNGNQNRSVNNNRRNLSAFFTWMRKQKLRPDNPVEGVEAYKVENKPIDHMEAPEWEQLKNGCVHPRDRAMIEFLRCTATRVGEVPDVRICDIDWRSGKISVNGHKTQTYRPVCLDDVAIKFIQEYLQWRGVGINSREPLFAHIRGNRKAGLCKDGIYSAVKKIAKRANMDRNVYPHLFRKTTATNIVKRGGSEEAAGEYLGHKPKSVTGQHYSFKSEEHTLRIFKDYVAAV